MNADQKWLETEFLIAICRRSGNKWPLKLLFLASFDPRLSIIKSVFDCRLPGVLISIVNTSAYFGGDELEI